MNDTYINVALLFAWVILYGLFAEGDNGGLLNNILYFVSSTEGFTSLLIYVSPLVAIYLGGKTSSLLFFLPLIHNAVDYAASVKDDYGQWYFWVSAAISFYASVKLAEQGDR